MSESQLEISVELIDVREFPKPLKNGALGMYFGKITHGVTCNFFSDVYYKWHLDAQKNLEISEYQALRSIKYSMSSEVLVAVQYLAGLGWFEDDVEFFIEGLEPWDEVKARGWADEWDTKAKVDIAYFLEDVFTELEYDGKTFLKEWYFAKIAHLYFLNGDDPDVAMNIGILLGQIWFKDASEAATLRGVAQEADLSKARATRKVKSIAKTREGNDVISALWHECKMIHGSEVMRRDSNAAQAIYILAAERRPKELIVGSTGEVIGAEAIRKRLPSLRKLEKIG